MRLLGALLFILCGALSYAQYSVLSNVDCGGGQATCRETVVSSTVGSVQCLCQATCFQGCRSQRRVQAGASLVWNCSGPIGVDLWGGTRPSGGSLVTQVFVSILVSGAPIYLDPNPLTNCDDCITGQWQTPAWSRVC
jgi:hypothetical protein